MSARRPNMLLLSVAISQKGKESVRSSEGIALREISVHLAHGDSLR